MHRSVKMRSVCEVCKCVAKCVRMCAVLSSVQRTKYKQSDKNSPNNPSYFIQYHHTLTHTP